MSARDDGGAVFEDIAVLVDRLKGDASLAEKVALLRQVRFVFSPEQYERLLWLAIGEAACVGGRLVLAELDAERQK